MIGIDQYKPHDKVICRCSLKKNGSKCNIHLLPATQSDLMFTPGLISIQTGFEFKVLLLDWLPNMARDLSLYNYLFHS